MWECRADIGPTAALVNQALGLTGDKELKPDLLNFTVGRTRSHLVVMGANPGWNEKADPQLQEYFAESAEAYWQYGLSFFRSYRRITGRRARYWTKALKFVVLLPENVSLPSKLRTSDQWWDWADDSGEVGSWELIPFHSKRDVITPKVRTVPWLRRLAVESLSAAIRLKPRILLATGPVVYDLLQNDMLAHGCWQELTVGNKPADLTLAYSRFDGSEVLLANKQIFANAPRPKNEVLLDAVARLHGLYDEKCNGLTGR